MKIFIDETAEFSEEQWEALQETTPLTWEWDTSGTSAALFYQGRRIGTFWTTYPPKLPPPVCSICRSRHGPEIIHACE